jgi:hypothetical protein
VGGYGAGLARLVSENNEGAEARRNSWRKGSSKVVKMDGKDTLELSESNLSESVAVVDEDWSMFQSACSRRTFLESGEGGGDRGRFSGRETMLLSVSAAEVPELDMRLVE